MFEKSTIQSLNHFLRFYTQYSIHVAFAIWSFYRSYLLMNKQKSDFHLDITLIFGSIAVYNILKYPNFRSITFRFQSNNQKIGYLLTLSCFAVSIFTFVNATLELQIKLLLSGVGVWLYPILRPFGIWKMFVVSIVISWTCVGIPLFEKLNFYHYIHVILSAALLLWIWLIPFEIFDRKNDRLLQPTLAQRLSVSQFKRAGLLCLSIWFTWSLHIINPEIPLFTISILTALAIVFTNEKRAYYYTALGVESLPILWYFSLLLHEHL